MDFYKILDRARSLGASDIHITPKEQVSYRINGDLKKEAGLLEELEVRQIIVGILDPASLDRLGQLGSIDLALEYGDHRFRVHIYSQATGYALAIRLIPIQVPSLDQLHLPRQLERIKELDSGLVIITGATGMGKTTSLAALVEDINQTRARHIVSLEDPIEYRFKSKKSLIHQRDLSQDQRDLGLALGSIVRQDPDIIVLGEMRSLETIRLGLSLAELGHLVLTTLHTRSVVDTVARILDVFSGEEKASIRTQLSYCLEYIVSQELIKIGDRRYPICEILKLGPGSRNIIRQEARLAGLRDQILMDRDHNLTREASYEKITRQLGLD